MGLQRRTTETATRGAERPAVGHAFVVVCLLIAALIMAPGIMGRLGIEPAAATPYAEQLKAFWATLDDIRFGSGLRFWLGVGGATAMALLLLYPVRKALAGRRGLGSIAGWFKLHLIIGIFAPVAILYHSNFGLGGTNANVALWTMLAVAMSGIVGHFVYARASAAFYSDKQTARRNLDGALAVITALDGAPLSRERLRDRLEQFDAEQLSPRPGLRASFSARYAVSKNKRLLIHEAVTVVDQAARETQLDAQQHAQARLQVAKLLHAYFAFVSRASGRSLREQVWAVWRMFHLPLFLIMCGATALHVIAVWDMDGPAPATPVKTAPVAPAPTPVTKKDDVASARSAPIQQVKRSTISVDPNATVTAAAPAPTPAPQRKPVSKPVEAQPAPQPVTAPVEARPVARPTPIEPASPVAVAAPQPPPAAAPKADAKLYEELAKRSEGDAQRMGLGKGRTLEQQIETFKAKIKTREFKHSEAETGFALTGKHTRADCTDCHTKPLQEVRSEDPRQCIACHKKDDVHKGRRPDCADCHTTNSFRDRKKKGR